MKIKFDSENDSWLRGQPSQESQDDPNIIKIKLEDFSQVMLIPTKDASTTIAKVATRWRLLGH
jgi:hypothetical protein